MTAQARLQVRGLGIDGSRQNETGNFSLPVVLLESQSGEKRRISIQLAVSISLGGRGIRSCVCREKLGGTNSQMGEKPKKRNASRSYE